MKKIIAAMMSIFVMLQSNVVAYAQAQPTIYLCAPTSSSGELAEIQVKIKNNTGLMGIKLRVEYAAAQIELRSISRGEVLGIGDFSTDFGEQVGHFQVLWHHTSAVKTDGVLFALQVQKSTDFEPKSIKIAYSREDTFDEKYQEVSLRCDNAKIYGPEYERKQTTSKSNTSAQTTQTGSKNAIANDAILKAVGQTLRQQHATAMADVQNQKAFLNAFNANLIQVTGDSSCTMKRFDEVQNAYQSAYQGEYIKKVENGMGTATARAILSKALKEAHASSVQDVRDQTAFVAAVQQQLLLADATLPKLTEHVDTDTAMAIFASLYTPQDTVVTDQAKKQGKATGPAIPIIIVLAAALVLVPIAIGQGKKRKGKAKRSI